MSRYQRMKGARGEREVVALLKAVGLDAYTTRSVQAQRACRCGDVDWPGCEWAIEVKIGQSWTVQAAWRQVVREAEASGRKPVLIARRDRDDWWVWCRAADAPAFWVCEPRIKTDAVVTAPAAQWIRRVSGQTYTGEALEVSNG